MNTDLADDTYQVDIKIDYVSKSSSGSGSTTGQGISTISLEDAGALALNNVKQNIPQKISYVGVSLKVYDSKTFNGVTTPFTASGSGSATSDGKSNSSTILKSAYNYAFQAASDSLSYAEGLMNHVDSHYSVDQRNNKIN
jgi:hypothetical protein